MAHRIDGETHVPSARTIPLGPTAAVGWGLFFMLVAIVRLPVFAQGRVCADDVAKFCQGIEGGQGKLMQCLQEHQSELSSRCQARVQAMETRMREITDACQSDVRQFCTGVNPGAGRIAQCLKQHESELSSTCKAELAPARSMRRPTR
jgi:Cysteine rich repeat